MSISPPHLGGTARRSRRRWSPLSASATSITRCRRCLGFLRRRELDREGLGKDRLQHRRPPPGGHRHERSTTSSCWSVRRTESCMARGRRPFPKSTASCEARSTCPYRTNPSTCATSGQQARSPQRRGRPTRVYARSCTSGSEPPRHSGALHAPSTALGGVTAVVPCGSGVVVRRGPTAPKKAKGRRNPRGVDIGECRGVASMPSGEPRVGVATLLQATSSK